MVTTHNTTTPRVGILLENHFEDSEFKLPYRALQDAGVDVVVLGSRMNDEYEGKRGKLTFSPANWQGDSWFVDPPLNLRQANS
ncbi:MAG: hypothetical protein ACP5D4_20865, partial [Baaleninema sp.]